MTKKIASATEGIRSDLFSPVKLFRNGLITADEYKNISKHNIVKLRIYHNSTAPLFVKVALRMTLRKVHRTVRKHFFGY